MKERIRQSRRGVRRGALVILVAGAVGCGNLTAGGFGEATVVVSADSPEAAALSAGGAPQPSVVTSLPTEPPARSDHDDHPEGQLDAEMLLYLVSESGDLQSLSDDVVEVQVDLEGVEQDETPPRTLPADTYARLRVVFLKIEVRVDAGLVIAGDTVTGPIEIDMESDSLVVERTISLRIDDGDRAEILVDLNAAGWLQAVDPTTSTVSAQDFADLIAVVLR